MKSIGIATREETQEWWDEVWEKYLQTLKERGLIHSDMPVIKRRLCDECLKCDHADCYRQGWTAERATQDNRRRVKEKREGRG